MAIEVALGAVARPHRHPTEVAVVVAVTLEPAELAARHTKCSASEIAIETRLDPDLGYSTAFASEIALVAGSPKHLSDLTVGLAAAISV